ncbi:unnamed protein product [Malus baccata var. baccata]
MDLGPISGKDLQRSSAPDSGELRLKEGNIRSKLTEYANGIRHVPARLAVPWPAREWSENSSKNIGLFLRLSRPRWYIQLPQLSNNYAARRKPRPSAEPSFPNIAQLGEAIANVIQDLLRPPQKTHLETVYNLKLNHFMGNEGHEGAEQKRFIPPEYIDGKKQEFTHLKQGKMTASEYYMRFTDLSRYDPEVAANSVEMLRRFILGTQKKWRSTATTTSCATYQEFYKILLRIEDLEKMPSESDEEENDGNQKKNDKGEGQSSQGPRKTQSFKRSGASSSSSSGGSRFQRQRDFGGSRSSFCRMRNSQHFRECKQGSRGCFICGQLGHRVMLCPHNQQRPHQLSLPPPGPTQQVSGPSGYAQTGHEGAYHYQGGVTPYSVGQYQYPHDLYQQSGYPQYSGGSSRQSNQPIQGRNVQGRSGQSSRGRGGRQQAQGRIHHMTLQDAQNNPDLIMGTLNILVILLEY